MTQHAERPPLFCDVTLAERIERVEAELIARSSDAARHRRGDATGFATSVAGGGAGFAPGGSPLDKGAGPRLGRGTRPPGGGDGGGGLAACRAPRGGGGA